MVSDAVRLQILAQYHTLAREKTAFETTFQAFLAHHSSGPANEPLFRDAVAGYHALFVAAEHLSATLNVYFPWAFEQFASVVRDDLSQLLGFLYQYAEVLKSFATKFGWAGAPLPTGADYETFRHLGALSASPAERAAIRGTATALGAATWDDARLVQLETALAASMQPIPSGVTLTHPQYLKFRDLFLVQRRPFAIILGAGAAINVTSKGLPTGLPDWDELLRYLIDVAKRYGMAPGEAKLCEDWVAKNNGNNAADLCKKYIGDYWSEEIEKVFAWPAVEPRLRNTSLYRNLAELPFFARLTFNYDSSYERVNNVDFLSAAFLEHALIRWQRNQWREKLLKLHGNIDSGEPIVLSTGEYVALYGRPDWDNLLQRLFQSYQILFLGASLSDARFEFLLSKAGVAATKAIPDHVHFMITEEQPSAIVDMWRANHRVNLIPFPHGQYAYVNYYVQDLLDFYRKLKASSP